MGMYTGIRCKVVIKQKYRNEIERLLTMDHGVDWKKSICGFMKEYGKDFRSNMIPNGALAYMPDSWDSDKEFEHRFDKATGLWVFQCSLKNYEDTIENFFENVLVRIAEDIQYLEYFYEEWEKGKIYKLINDEILLTNERVDYPVSF